MKELKSEIKTLEAEQKSLKPQRKTIHFLGERTVEPDMAAAKVRGNKERLRHLYLVYGTLRGKTPEQVEPNCKSKPNTWLLDKLMDKYRPIEVLV